MNSTTINNKSKSTLTPNMDFDTLSNYMLYLYPKSFNGIYTSAPALTH